jgi:hypothetical protein
MEVYPDKQEEVKKIVTGTDGDYELKLWLGEN